MTAQAKQARVPGGKRIRVGHLDSLSGVLKEMGKVYRSARTGQTPISDAARLTYCLRCMRDVLETIVLERIEKRLDALADLATQQDFTANGYAKPAEETVRAH